MLVLLPTLSAASRLHSSRLPFSVAQSFPSQCRRYCLVQGASARRKHSDRSRGAQASAKLSLSRKLILSSAVFAGALALWATRLSDLSAEHPALVVPVKGVESLGYKMLCVSVPYVNIMQEGLCACRAGKRAASLPASCSAGHA